MHKGSIITTHIATCGCGREEIVKPKLGESIWEALARQHWLYNNGDLKCPMCNRDPLIDIERIVKNATNKGIDV